MLLNIYRYRELVGKLEAGWGLDVNDMLELNALEARFAVAGGVDEERRTRRALVRLAARLRASGEPCARVGVHELGGGGLVCRRAPFVHEGRPLEVVFDTRGLSLRFATRIVWTRRDHDAFALGLSFVGAPILVRGVMRAS